MPGVTAQVHRRLQQIADPVAQIRAQAQETTRHTRLYEAEIARPKNRTNCRESCSDFGLEIEKLGGHPFHDQVADCRSARSSAPRVHEKSRQSFARKHARSRCEYIAVMRQPARNYERRSSRPKCVNQNSFATQRDCDRPAGNRAEASDHTVAVEQRCSADQPALPHRAFAFHFDINRLGVLCGVAASCQQRRLAIFFARDRIRPR